MNRKVLLGVLALCGVAAYFFFQTPETPKKDVSSQPELSVSPSPSSSQQIVLQKSLPEGSAHALTRFGAPKYAPQFTHFDYVNPNAVKGGELKLSTIGTFDTVNKDIVKGIGAEGLLLLYDPLMVRSADEPFTLYALIARAVKVAPDFSSVTFYIDERARFQDGSPVTAHDIQFTMQTLLEKGLPRYRQHYSRVERFDIADPLTITMHLKPNADGVFDPELPMILANMRVLSKKQLESLNFAESGLTPIIGSGPYKIAAVDQGRSITYQRDPNYWAKDFPVNKGSYNFDTIKIEYFKNAQSQFQAFTAGEFDVYFETNPNQWESAYNFAAVTEGRIKKVDATHRRPVAVRTFIFNMHKPLFQDRRVRKAIGLAFDFNTLNRVVFYNTMQCPNSLFANTFLAHSGPASAEERALLERFKDKIEPTLFNEMLEKAYAPAQTKGNGDQRDNLAEAATLLKSAGWIIQDGVCVNANKEPLTVELLIKDPKLEKVALSFKESLKKIGVVLNVRMMDAVQYENRVVERDFDMIIHTWANSLSPGNEQAYYFSVKNADVKGSSNYIGLKDPIAETLAQDIPLAKTVEDLANRVHALDRYVMYQYIQIPLCYDNTSRWAYWVDRFDIPPVQPEIGTNIMNWGWTKK